MLLFPQRKLFIALISVCGAMARLFVVLNMFQLELLIVALSGAQQWQVIGFDVIVYPKSIIDCQKLLIRPLRTLYIIFELSFSNMAVPRREKLLDETFWDMRQNCRSNLIISVVCTALCLQMLDANHIERVKTM
jgi:hypothetical protein